jgi:hypothetical protein
MIWLTWRQFRTQAAAVFAALAALAIVLAITGPGLADDYSTGIANCSTQRTGCDSFVDAFFSGHQSAFLLVTLAVLVLPITIGLFWGAPLITRELEAGTHRLVWNQTVTRTRWLAVKLGLIGVAAAIAAGLGTGAVGWWSSPLDKAASEFPRMGPIMFAARGIVPIAYAVFAFALGVTVGILVRRTLPAMAITLVAFIAVQAAMPLLIRPHLASPVQSTVEITASNIDGLSLPQNGSGSIRVWARARVSSDPGAWVLSSETVDASGHAVDTVPLSSTSGPCAPSGPPDQSIRTCLAEVTRLGYRQHLTYQPSTRFWAFQWYETGMYAALTLGLAGFSFWRIRRRLT